jgi:pantoate--beta-alanine ligase
MKLIKTVADLRKNLPGQRRVALVPTMGNLHAGHLSLVLQARKHADVVITSIFVNPLQFAPHEDFLQYPRTLERDCELLEDVGCDAVFAPEERDIYVEGQIVRVTPPTIADILEGAARPGFFAGVCTVVLKLFTMVRPKVAVFGKKDYQQVLVVRQMARQLGLPLEIVVGEIVRDAQGVALSSRNSYLSAAEYAEAPRLSTVLRETACAARVEGADRLELERLGRDRLAAHGWQPDYIAIRRQSDLGEPSAADPIVVLGAARLGRTRLIDNVEA